MKKTGVILGMWMLFCFLLAIIQSCDPCDDGPLDYRLVSITGEVKRITEIESLGSHQTANYIVEQYVGQTNGVRYDSIGIDIFNTVELLAYDKEVDFFTSAFACSPATTFELLADMTIISSADYTDSYPAGTDLKEIMSIREGYQQQGSHILAYLSNAELTEGNLFLTFEIPPSQNSAHDITVTYKLFDGREFEVIIQGLKING